MAIREYEINKGYQDARTVKASDIEILDDFIDFSDGDGLVLRLRKASIYTLERKSAG